MDPASSKPVSQLLLRWTNGHPEALEEIWPLLYHELRRSARNHLRQGRPNHTLQTTALVHEAYLRLTEQRPVQVKNRAHFFGIAAQVMRWILVDYERGRRAAKRGAGVNPLMIDDSIAEARSSRERNIDVLALDEALEKLAKLDVQQSQIVELRYFAGLSIQDTSEFLGISPSTVKREWMSARAWLHNQMSKSERGSKQAGAASG